MSTAQQLPMRLTTEQAAEYLCCEESTVQTKATTGELRGAKVGKNWIFLARDVEDFFQQQIEAQQMKIQSKKTKPEKSKADKTKSTPPSLD